MGISGSDSTQAITPISDLELIAQRRIEDMSLQIYPIDPNDIRLRSQEGDLVFSSSAFSDYLNMVGNSERSRAIFKRVLEQPADPKNSRMYEIIVSYLQSLNTVGNSTNVPLHRELVGYLASNQYIILYSRINPPLTREILDSTPRIAVRLETRR